MIGNRDSLSAMIGDLAGNGAIRRRILQTIFPLLLVLPRRANFKQMARLSRRNEGTIHNWLSKRLELVEFQRSLIDRHGSGSYCTLFDPSYLPKSGKCTSGLGRYWSGQAGAVKRGLELGAFAVGDVGHHTAFHLSASMTPSQTDLKLAGKSLMGHYVSLVADRKADILHFGKFLAVDGYFGVATFVNPVTEMGIEVISCIKSNSALHYVPVVQSDKKGRGRPRVKGDKINWSDVDETALPLVAQNEDMHVRSGRVWVKCLRRVVVLAAVEYLRPDGALQCRKLYFCTDINKNWEWIGERYSLRFHIEFLFRDAKQFTGLTHCQSTNPTKIENHVNLALGAVSVAKAAHWIPQQQEHRGPFSMEEIKTYYHNLELIERFSVALNLNPTEIKNNPKIKKLLFSTSYENIAA
jgi:Transposase DDE domain